ncbi:hypothetical protein LguiA_027882 [Lonicera macranthoides]
MKQLALDYVLVPLGVGLFGLYHIWLLYTIARNPRRTVIGLNTESRQKWVFSMMADPAANGVLVIQTIRNNIMAATLLATAAITLSSLIGVYVSSTSNTANTASKLVYGNKTQIVSSIKYFAVLICYLVAFLCNVEAIRYYSHVSFMATMPTLKGKIEPMEYIARNLNRGSYFWSFGLRAFYLSFPLFLWIFGPIPMFSCCFIMLFVLHFLDTTTSFTRNLHKSSMIDETKGKDIGSV